MSGSIFQRFRSVSAAAVFAAALFLLLLGLFFGNACIAAGHVVAIAALVMIYREKGKDALIWKGLRPSAKWLMLFVTVAAVSIFVNWQIIPEPFDHLKKLRYFLIFLGFLLMPSLFEQVYHRIDKRNWLVLAWVIPLALAVILGFVGFWTGSHPIRKNVIDIERVSGLYGQVMTFAYTLQFSVIALASFLVSPTIWKRISRVPFFVVVVALLVAGAALYFSYTRGAMLGVVVGFTVFAMMKSRWLILLVVLVGMAGGAYAYKERARYFKFESSIRLSQWKTASLGFLERPVFGFGFHNFEHHCVELKKKYGFEKDKKERINKKRVWSYFEGHAHNNFLEAFVSTGFLGGIALLGFCYCWIREAWKSGYAVYFVPLISAFLVSGFFENTFFDSEVLNCILLIYLFTQMVLDWEKGRLDEASPKPLS
ncbi:MAG: hypothetical protein CMO55_20300 [Verrucomicrobiales bacterium]|nr:hypothetical protein [Verrucomicrobiales bacterium]